MKNELYHFWFSPWQSKSPGFGHHRCPHTTLLHDKRVAYTEITRTKSTGRSKVTDYIYLGKQYGTPEVIYNDPNWEKYKPEESGMKVIIEKQRILKDVPVVMTHNNTLYSAVKDITIKETIEAHIKVFITRDTKRFKGFPESNMLHLHNPK